MILMPLEFYEAARLYFVRGSFGEPEFELFYFERSMATGSTGRELTTLCALRAALVCG